MEKRTGQHTGNTGRIFDVTIKHEVDTDSDTSELGTFDDAPRSKYAIRHSKGDHRVMDWFNPNWENYKGCTQKEIREYCRQDYQRAKSYGQEWGYVGIIVTASLENVELGNASLWGIEDDGGDDYIATTEKDLILDAIHDAEANLAKLQAA